MFAVYEHEPNLQYFGSERRRRRQQGETHVSTANYAPPNAIYSDGYVRGGQ